MSRAAPRAASVATCCSPRASRRAASVAASISRVVSESPSFRHRVGLPEEDGRGLARPERAQRDTSRVEGPTRDSMITEFERLFGSVDGPLEGCSPVTTSSRDPRFDLRRVRDAQAVADPGADLDGFVEQGERAFGLLEREPESRGFGRANASVPSMPAARATRTASSMVAIAASSVGSVIWSAPPSDDECVCEFEWVSRRSRELDPFLRVTSRPLEVVAIEREESPEPAPRTQAVYRAPLGLVPRRRRGLRPARNRDPWWRPTRPRRRHGKERVTVAARDRDRGRGPVHREFAGPACTANGATRRSACSGEGVSTAQSSAARKLSMSRSMTLVHSRCSRPRRCGPAASARAT